MLRRLGSGPLHNAPAHAPSDRQWHPISRSEAAKWILYLRWQGQITGLRYTLRPEPCR